MPHQYPADFGGTGEGDLADDIIAGHLSSNRRGICAADNIDHACGNAGTVSQFGKGKGGKRRLCGGLEHHGTAGGNGRRDLAGDHRIGEIPRRDGGNNADRLFQHHQAFVGHMRLQDITGDAATFFGKPVDERGAIGDLTTGFGQRLAHLGGDDLRQIFLIFHDQIEPAPHQHGAVLGGASSPFFLCGGGDINRFAHGIGTMVGNISELLACCRINERKTAVGVAPGTVDITRCLDKAAVAQFHDHLRQVDFGALRKGGMTAPFPNVYLYPPTCVRRRFPS